MLISLAGSILSLVRLFELFDITEFFSKKNDSNDEFEINEINSSRDFSKRQTLSSSTIMTNTYLIEYMFFIIQGILSIGREVDKQNKISFSIKYSLFIIENHLIKKLLIITLFILI